MQTISPAELRALIKKGWWVTTKVLFFDQVSKLANVTVIAISDADNCKCLTEIEDVGRN